MGSRAFGPPRWLALVPAHRGAHRSVLIAFHRIGLHSALFCRVAPCDLAASELASEACEIAVVARRASCNFGKRTPFKSVFAADFLTHTWVCNSHTLIWQRPK